MTVTLNFEDKITIFDEKSRIKKKTDLVRIDSRGPKFQKIHDNCHCNLQHRAGGPWQTLHRIHKLIEHKMKLHRHM